MKTEDALRAEMYGAIIEMVQARTDAALAKGVQLLTPGYHDRLRPTDGELQKLIADLVEMHGDANYPIRLETDPERVGENWSLGWYERGEHGEGEVYVTTDRVRASEITGDALSDGQGWVLLRNAAPVLIACLLELAERRRPETP